MKQRLNPPPAIGLLAARCGLATLGVAASVVLALALIGALVDNLDAVSAACARMWSLVLWGVSFGGRFWGAVGVGTFAATALAWAVCVLSKLDLNAESPRSVDRMAKALFVACIVSWALWLVADFAMLGASDRDVDPSGYRDTARFVMQAPILLGILCFLGILSMLRADD